MVALLGICAMGVRSFAAEKPGNGKNTVKSSATGFAVVELFTSEGCSSCPPADELISRIQKESNGKPIYILAYHVDYWNRLGWKDQFSSAAFTQRQNQYAEWMNLSSVYTPQAVVNGSKEFVGSEEGTLRNAIQSGLQKTSVADLSLKNIRIDHDKIDLEYHSDGSIGSTTLLVALVQKNAISKVLRGENGGRTLSHVQIVKSVQAINSNQKRDGTASLSIPDGTNTDNLEVIAFVQKNSNGEIIAAAKSPVVLGTIVAKNN